jgi:pimeloyl-ACP methyl ester carboxylesterase
MNEQRTPVVFIHGLWLLPSSWDRWAEVFAAADYEPVLARWPGDADTVEQARANPGSVAGKTIGPVADSIAQQIQALGRKPAIVGHSFGGLLTQILAGRGLSVASVAIDPAPFRGVLALPISTLRSAMPVLGNPLNRGKALSLTLDQFKYGWANALSDEEAAQIHSEFHVPAPAAPIFQGASANLNPFSDLKVDTKSSDRGPLLVISGEKDNTVPHAISHGSYKKQTHNPGVTEFKELPNRGHALTIDSGWREVCDTALEFVKRFT